MTVSPTPDYSTQAETAPGMIRNALQVALLHSHERINGSPAFAEIVRLLKSALSKLDGREAAHPQGDK